MVVTPKRGRRRLTLAAAALTTVAGVGLLLRWSHAAPFNYIREVDRLPPAVSGVTVRWDIISIPSFTPTLNLKAAGQASAVAMGGARITLTGSGTFHPDGRNVVTGGGTWTLANTAGTVLGMGTYQVSALSQWNPGPGTEAPGTIDNIGRGADFQSGLAFLKVHYSDGSRGILILSCHAPQGGVDAIPEGVSLCKDNVFFNMELPKPNVDWDRTSFHLVPLVPARG